MLRHEPLGKVLSFPLPSGNVAGYDRIHFVVCDLYRLLRIAHVILKAKRQRVVADPLPSS